MIPTEYPVLKSNPQKKNPVVSILICTFNRVGVLGDTIDSLLKQDFGWGEYEIIVVDNASTDGTKELAEKYVERDPRVHYMHEPKLGVAIARNTGARASKAPYIAYFDDDLIAEPDCLHKLMAPFFEMEPEPACVIGQSELQWNGERPRWFPEKYETLLSRFYMGDKPRKLVPGEYLITMNVAFEREKFLEAGGIREDLSRKGRMFICSGDNDIFNRYMQLGLTVYYEPNALIWHLVPASRQKRKWLYKRVAGEGTSQTIEKYAKSPKKAILRRSLYDMKIAVLMGGKAMKNGIMGRREQKLDAYIEFIRQLGRLSGEAQLVLNVRNVRTFSE